MKVGVALAPAPSLRVDVSGPAVQGGPATTLEAGLQAMLALRSDFTVVPMAAFLTYSSSTTTTPAATEEDPWSLDEPGCIGLGIGSDKGFTSGGAARRLLHMMSSCSRWARLTCGACTPEQWAAVVGATEQIESEMQLASFLGLSSVIVPLATDEAEMQHAVSAIRKHLDAPQACPVWVACTLGRGDTGTSVWDAFHKLHSRVEFAKMVRPLPILTTTASVEGDTMQVPGHDAWLPFLGEHPPALGVVLHQPFTANWEGAQPATPSSSAPNEAARRAALVRAVPTCVGNDAVNFKLGETATASPPPESAVAEFLRRRIPLLGIVDSSVWPTENTASPMEQFDAMYSSFANLMGQAMAMQQIMAPDEEEFEALHGLPNVMSLEDRLQTPLQPLQDHLSTQTYSVFEADDAKYELYGQAIQARLMAWSATAYTSAEELVEVDIVVLGAGRGPLVTRALRAIAEMQAAGSHSSAAYAPLRNCRVVAVEKNPGAIAHLRLRRDADPEWAEIFELLSGTEAQATIAGNNVEVVWADGRDCAKLVNIQPFAPTNGNPPRHFLLISELLGSFGDNELSPECIDGCLASFGIDDAAPNPRFASIPHSYTSYAAPVSSRVLHEAAMQLQERRKQNARTDDNESPDTSHPGTAESGGAEAAVSTLRVALPRKAAKLASALPVFHFTHDGTGASHVSDATATFSASHAGSITGLLGFFSAVLCPSVRYGGSEHPPVMLSTVPEPSKHSENMLSWFPAVFTILDPIPVHTNDTIEFRIGREANREAVWYRFELTVRRGQGDEDGTTAGPFLTQPMLLA